MELHDQTEAPRDFVAAIVRGILSEQSKLPGVGSVMDAWDNMCLPVMINIPWPWPGATVKTVEKVNITKDTRLLDAMLKIKDMKGIKDGTGVLAVSASGEAAVLTQ